jgi:hypothetical protein
MSMVFIAEVIRASYDVPWDGKVIRQKGGLAGKRGQEDEESKIIIFVFRLTFFCHLAIDQAGRRI